MRTQYYQQRFARTTLALAISAAFAAPAMAFDATWLTHPSLQGRVTFDAFLGNADDITVPGINTIGAASSFLASNGIYAFFKGSHSGQGQTIFGLQDRLVFGTNVFNSSDLSGEADIFFPPHFNEPGTFNIPFAQHLDLNSPHTFTINHDQSYNDSFVMDDSLSGGHVEVTGLGHYLLNFQNAADLYSGNELTHFNFVRPLLPSNFAGVAHEIQTWKILDGPNAGVTGTNTLTFFSTDFAQTQPQDPPLALGAPWVTTGFAAINGLNAAIGSPGAPAADGTAALSNGNTATLNGLTLGSKGNGSVTVEGVGSALSREDLALGFVDVEGTGNASLTILNGGKMLSSTMIHFAPQGSLETHVSGLGSELNLTCPAGVNCGIVGLFDGSSRLRGDPDISGTTVDNGGRIDIVGKGDSLTGINLFGNHTLRVDGENSEIHITGSQNIGANSSASTGVGIEQTATATVTNGGKIVIVSGNAGVNGLAIGSQFAADATKPAATEVVDGANSLIDAGALVSVGELVVFDNNLKQYVRSGAGGLSELVVRNGGLVKADTIFIGLSGTVKGNGGALQGAVENHGIIAPGESPGTLNIQGDLTQASDGKLVIEIGGNSPSLFDVLHVSGKFTMGGTLEIDLLNGFIPGANDVFSFLNADSFDGAFANFILPTLSNGKTLQLNFGPHGISASANPVPLPAGVLLLGSALVGLRIRRRQAT